MTKRYGSCVCHDKLRSLNAKGLCPIGAKERHEKSTLSKGFTIKKKDDECSERSLETRMPIRPIGSKKTKINAISKEKAAENAELARLKKAKILEFGEKCEMCDNEGKVDLFHIITVGNKKFSTNPINLILSCRRCHDIWGANDWSKIVKFKNFGEIMSRLKSLDVGKYWKLKHKIEKYEQPF